MLEIVGSGNLDTDEYAAALKLEKLIKEEIPNVEEEKDLFIYLIPSVYLARMTTKDIDLVLFYADFRKKNPLKTSYGITVHSFISTIEVKTHVGEGVVFTGTDCSVKYQDKSKPSSATEQARKQMEKLKKHLGNEFYHRKIFSPVPHVLNGIYLINYSKENLPDTVEGVSRSNIFAGDSSFREIVETLVNTNIDFLEKHQLKNQSTFKNIHELEQASAPLKKVTQLSDMDRKKVETFTRKRLDKDTEYFKNLGNQLLIFRGRGGTGKTVKLLNLAYNVYREGRRVLLLTYNKALVKDISRQLDHLGIGNTMAGAGFTSRGIMSFMHEWLQEFRKFVGEEPWADKDFYSKYEILKNEFRSYLEEETILSDDINQIKNNKFTSLFWDYIFIDEAQDWPVNEKDIIYKLYGYKNVVIADGVDQVVRSNQLINWREGVGSDSQIVTLRSSLRLKVKLCKATQLFAKKIQYNEWDLEPDVGLHAGRVIIILGNPLSPNAFETGGFHRKFWKTIEDAKDKKSNIQPVDTLSIIPSSWVIEKEKKKTSKLGDLYKENGRKVWDGSVEDGRDDFPRDLDQFRIVQYTSCRGLEGWMVVNYAIDEQYNDLLKYPIIDESRKNDLLFNQEKDELAEQYAKKSIMIPFTRAIDTLFVHVSDPNSYIGSTLMELHEEHPEIFQLEIISENTVASDLLSQTENQLKNVIHPASSENLVTRGSEKPDFTRMDSFLVKVKKIKHDTGDSERTLKQWKTLTVMYKDEFEIVDIRHRTANFFVSEGDEIWIKWVIKTKSTPGFYSVKTNKIISDDNSRF